VVTLTQTLRTNSIKYLILNFLYRYRSNAFTRPKIFFGLKLSTDNAAVFNKTFELVKTMPYIIVKDNVVQWDDRYFISKLHVNHVEFAYRDKDKFLVSYQNMLHPMDGDDVVVVVSDEKRLTGNVVDVIKRTTKAIRGTVSNLNGTTFIIPEDKTRYKHDIYISGVSLPDFTKVEVKLNEFDTKLKPAGIVNRQIRNTADDTKKNKQSILAKHGFSYNFSN
jgi:exoribonuclease R